MKSLFSLLLMSLLFFTSCSNDDDLELTTIRVNHYKDTSFVTFFGIPSTTIAIQTGDEIGTNTFNTSSIAIEGFEYELGFIYDLQVLITEIENPPADAPNTKTTLIKTLSKTPISSDTQFKVRLTLNQQDIGFTNWVNIEGANYNFANSEIAIDCGDLCSELTTRIGNQEQITGVFIHGDGERYILQEILSQ